MLKTITLFMVVLTLSSVVLAQQKNQQTPPDRVALDATTTCNVTFASGTGINATQFCVTANGNIAQFSVGGEEMIAVGATEEGYGICDTGPGVSYFDYADSDSGNWGPSTFSHVGNVVTVTRSTLDGIWKLKQIITNVPATKAGPGSARVSMTLTNLSTDVRNAVVLRHANVDANSVITNDFDFTAETAYGLLPGFLTGNLGLGSTNNTFNPAIFQVAYTQNVNFGPDPCKPTTNLAPQPFVGDGSIEQGYEFNVGKKGVQTVTLTYKPI